MVSGSIRTQRFLFVPVNADSSDEVSRKSIRAHVMREAHYQKVTGTEPGGTHNPVNYWTGQFRLSASPARAKMESKSASQFSSASLSIIPAPGKIDPFESLPIPFGSQQQMLLSYCKCYSLSRSVVCGYDTRESALSTEADYEYASDMKLLGHMHCYTITTEAFVVRPRNPMRFNSL